MPLTFLHTAVQVLVGVEVLGPAGQDRTGTTMGPPRPVAGGPALLALPCQACNFPPGPQWVAHTMASCCRGGGRSSAHTSATNSPSACCVLICSRNPHMSVGGVVTCCWVPPMVLLVTCLGVCLLHLKPSQPRTECSRTSRSHGRKGRPAPQGLRARQHPPQMPC